MKNEFWLRFISFLFAFLIVLATPWYFSLLVVLFFCIYFDFYLEILFFGFLMDILYFPGNSFVYPSLIVSTVALSVVSFVKTKIRT